MKQRVFSRFLFLGSFRNRLRGGPLGAAVTGILVGLASAPVWGEEPAESFLDALRERGYHQVALEYLDRLENSPLAPPQFQEELAYHRGVTQVRAAVSSPNRTVRERMLGEAKASLEAFLAEHPESPRRTTAQRQYALLLREWARMKVEAAQSQDDQKAELLEKAASLYEEAHKASVRSVEALKERLRALKEASGGEQQEDTEQRDTLRGEYLLALLGATESLEEKAATRPADSAARRSLLQRAIEKYDEIFQKYGGYLAGLRARFYQARCLTKLGDEETALEYLTKDLFPQIDDRPAARQLKTKAMLLAMECWMDESRADYAKVIGQGQPWLKTIRPAEEEQPNWLLLRLQLARAYKRYAEQLSEKKPRDDRIKSSRDSARQLARTVARLSSSYQQEARELLATIPGGIAAADSGSEPSDSPETFEEARTRGTEAISAMQIADDLLDELPGQLQEATDEEAQADLRKKLKQAEETVPVKRREAKQHLQLALRLADPETPMEDVNQVRRLLAYLYYVDQKYYQAIVLGEFIAHRYPSTRGARQGAQIALAAYLKLYKTNPSEDKRFETRRVISLANYVVETWSGTPQAAEAINTLIPFLIRQGNLDKARRYVENIPPSTPERGSAELRIGEALWRDYLEGMQELRQWEKQLGEGEEGSARLKSKIEAREPQLRSLRQTALEILESGVQRMKETSGVSGTVPLAVLALAQIYVDSGKAVQAISLLDHPKVGVLSMIKRDDPLVQSRKLRVRAYRVALSAMVSTLPTLEAGEQRTRQLQRIRATIQKLREEVGDASESQEQLADIFYSLARGLETQLQLLDDPADRRVLSNGFRAFLEQVRNESNDLRVLNWVAESFASLGEGLTGTDNSSAAARNCYMNAVSTYDDILAHSEQHGIPPDLRRQLRFRKALALRGAEEFAEAVKILKWVLEKQNSTLEYQMETAGTYQLWAADPQEGIRYLTAIRGTKADPETGKRTVWGWSRIAAVTQPRKKYREDFLEARYNTAVCHFKLGLRLRKDSDRKAYLRKANNDIVFTYRLYPRLGGEKWFQKYNALLKEIQRSRGKAAVGLSEESAHAAVGQS